jgi:hemerythrin-like domain-containing protein
MGAKSGRRGGDFRGRSQMEWFMQWMQSVMWADEQTYDHYRSGDGTMGGTSTTVTALLRAEHDVILGVVGAVMRVVESGGRLADSAFWQNVVAFFRGFADRCHHAKEEAVLFPSLEARGVPRSGGPLGAMLAEHEHGRELLTSIAELRARLAGADREVRAAFLRAVREYCVLLARHIERENEVLFPIAERLLSRADQREILKWFPAQGCDGADVQEQLLAIADRIRRAT